MSYAFLRVAALGVALQMGAASAFAETAKDPVVAVVNGQDIHLSSVQDAYRSIPQLRQVPFDAVYPQLLETLVNDRILAGEARKQKLQDDPVVKQRLKDLETKLMQQAYLSKLVDGKVNDKAIQKRYDEVLKSRPPEELVRARHILVETEAEAKAILADLKKGAKFEDLAKAKSKDPGSGAQGGDLDYFAKSDMVPAFADTAFALKPGQLGDKPVQTQFGWHVIKVEDRKMSEPPKLEQVKEQIRAELAEGVVTEILKELRSKAEVKKFAADGGPFVETPAAP